MRAIRAVAQSKDNIAPAWKHLLGGNLKGMSARSREQPIRHTLLSGTFRIITWIDTRNAHKAASGLNDIHGIP